MTQFDIIEQIKTDSNLSHLQTRILDHYPRDQQNNCPKQSPNNSVMGTSRESNPKE